MKETPEPDQRSGSSAHRRANFRDCAGFTLLEVMIVLAVISLLAIVTAPKYQALTDRYRLESSAQIVAQELRYAKQLAMDQRITVYVVLNQGTVQTFKYINSHYEAADSSKAFDTGVKFDPGQNAWLAQIQDGSTILGWGLSFTNRGFASLSGKIVLVNQRSRSVQIEIAEKTGNISISWP